VQSITATEWRIAARINKANFTCMMEKAQAEQEILQKKVDMLQQRLDGGGKGAGGQFKMAVIVFDD